MNVSWILKQVMLNKHKQFGRLSIYDRAVTFQNINQIINTDLHNCSCAPLAMKYLFLVWHFAMFWTWWGGKSQYYFHHFTLKNFIFKVYIFIKVIHRRSQIILQALLWKVAGPYAFPQHLPPWEQSFSTLMILVLISMALNNISKLVLLPHNYFSVLIIKF